MLFSKKRKIYQTEDTIFYIQTPFLLNHSDLFDLARIVEKKVLLKLQNQVLYNSIGISIGIYFINDSIESISPKVKHSWFSKLTKVTFVCE